jgi:hypothetical protein
MSMFAQVFGIARLLGVCQVAALRRTDKNTKGASSSATGSSEDQTSHRLLGEVEMEVEVVAPPVGSSLPPLSSAAPMDAVKEPKFK